MIAAAGGAPRALVMLLGVLVLAGCAGPSQVDPQADVTITGTATAADGTPARGATALLAKEIGLAEAAEGLALTLASVGFVCLTPAAPDVCRDRTMRTTVDDQGRFDFGLRGADTQSLLGMASTMNVTVGLPPADGQQAGPATTQLFTVHTPRIELSPVSLWDAAVTVTSAPAAFEVAWDPLPPRLGVTATYTLRFTDIRGQTVWATDTPPTSAAVDARILEDFTGGVGVEVARRSTAPGTAVELVYRSAQRLLEGTAGPPPSRGQVCTVFRSGAQPVAYAPCPFTDGDFAEPVVPHAPCPGEQGGPDCPAPDDTFVVVDLGVPRDLHMLVLRGTGGDYVVEASDDGLTWTPAARVHVAADAVIPLASGTRARLIRLRVPGGPVGPLRELSVW